MEIDMNPVYIVLDGEGNQSWDAEAEKAECFPNLPSATDRARELAQDEPGTTIGIYRICMKVKCEVADPVLTKVTS